MTLVAPTNALGMARYGTPRVVPLPPGEFQMGENLQDRFANDTERPAHSVRIPAGVAIGIFPVTVGEFRAFDPAHAPGEDEDLPVARVRWIDAVAFCEWLSQRTGNLYRLPTEAEWEYACRAGSRFPFSFGEEITPSQANFLYDEIGQRIGPGRRTAVGSYPRNAFGLYDVHGNICEWVADAWHPNFQGAPRQGEAWDDDGGAFRVIRGGAWDYLPRLLRSSWRDWRPADFRSDNLGFRIAQTISS